VFRQVVEAVWYLNRQGIVHCDIKDERYDWEKAEPQRDSVDEDVFGTGA
jgi:hypothetical protein